jgi:hypothetical protein
MWTDDMIWGVTLRSPHPYARIRSIDIGPALATPGVYAVLTHEDVPGSKFYGLEIVDQPVLAVDTVRYHGEPVALVAADHPEIARQAAKRIRGRLRRLRADHRRPRGPRPPAVEPGPQRPGEGQRAVPGAGRPAPAGQLWCGT